MTDLPSYVSFRDVSKHFGSVRALDGVSLDVKQGEFFALLGSSGCGKTTLLRILGGFEVPTSGSVHIDDTDMTVVPPNHRPVNMVFQNYAIFPHLSVRQNIAYGLRKSGLPKQEVARRADEALAMIKLEGYGDRRSNELSGGERQRVALARALVMQPKVLLLDEPLSALDKNLREQMRVELRALQQSVGITFVFVTHDQEEALSMADRIAVMSAGKVLQIDTPERLYEAPCSRDVASFIGSMNFFGATVKGTEDGKLVLDAGPLGLVYAAMPDSWTPAAGTSVSIGIRPEKLLLTERRPDTNCNEICGRLGAAAYLGERSHFFVRVEGHGEPVSVARQNNDRQVLQRSDTDRELWLSWEPASTIVLPA